MVTGGGASPDFVLRWPRELFTSEAAALLNGRAVWSSWDERCELLLEDAFVGSVPRDLFRAVPADPAASWRSSVMLNASQRYLSSLVQRADQLKMATDRAPYWTQRMAGAAPGRLTDEGTAREFVRLVRDLETRGYFESAFGKDCVDDPVDEAPSVILEDQLGVPNLWPLSAQLLADNRDTLFDVIEALHDVIARPRGRSLHNFMGCGWHHSDFSIAAGQYLYRWAVNRLLERGGSGLRLADRGDDAGRLVAVTDAARDDLVTRAVTSPDAGAGDVVRHAVALFRARTATEHDKRSAVVALAGLLEERRDLLKGQLARKDEGALFQVANEFALRHRNVSQKSDYDPVFLDWVFWWYLATIELTDRLLDRHPD